MAMVGLLSKEENVNVLYSVIVTDKKTRLHKCPKGKEEVKRPLTYWLRKQKHSAVFLAALILGCPSSPIHRVPHSFTETSFIIAHFVMCFELENVQIYLHFATNMDGSSIKNNWSWIQVSMKRENC